MNMMMQNERTPILERKLFPGMTAAGVIVMLIMLLSLIMHLINIDSIGDANAYYTAAVKSMLISWHNFFFAAAEPGGSVTVDKPPLGLWIEALFAHFLGVSGFSLSLPNILAGVFGLPLLYIMVKRYVGALAGILAALVMAITPVFLATNRNNTMDGLLVFFLLMAAWAFIRATDSGKARWLMLCAFIMGLGFNIKMLQAFLPLPAFYALYFLASKEGWFWKIAKLGLATLLLLVVSLSWAILVDMTPADQRPYIGSSGDNTVMGLILGHNGTSRLFSRAEKDGLAQIGGPDDGQLVPEVNRPVLQDGQANQGSLQTPGGQGGTPFSNETGVPGIFRFFTSPLSKQMSWLLPFALVSLGVSIFGARVQLPVESDLHKALILWGGWLLTCLVFFSAIGGIFHAYYAVMLAPPLGAVVGMGFSKMWNQNPREVWPAILLSLTAILTIGFQTFASHQYGELNGWLVTAWILMIAGVLLLIPRISRFAGYAVILTAMLLVPFYWTVMTVVTNSNVNLPTAYTGQITDGTGADGRARNMVVPNGGQPGGNLSDALVSYLVANTKDVYYLVAVPSSQNGAGLVLATGRPVLYMGGFGGQDQVVTVEDLVQKVEAGELRYILLGGDRGNQQGIQDWIQTSCALIPEFSQESARINIRQDGQAVQPAGIPDGGRDQAIKLYRCE